MTYLRQVYQNLKETSHIFTIIAVLLGLLLAFKSFPQELLIEVLKEQWILNYFYFLLMISFATIGTCFLQPLSLSRKLFVFWNYLMQSNRTFGSYSFHLFYVPLILMFIGVVIIYSFTRNYALVTFGNPSFLATRQLYWIIIGSALMLIFAKTKYTLFNQLSFPLMIFLIIFLFIQAFGLLPSNSGISSILADFKFNYWEITKFVFILYVAGELNKNRRKVFVAIPLFVVFALIGFAEGKAGLGIVLILSISGILMLLGKHNTRIAARILAILIFTLSAVISVFLYQKSEVLGGFFGVGLGRGISTYISSQLIVQAIIEELGFLGGLIILILFNFYCLLGIEIFIRVENPFGRLVILGIVAVITFQAFQYVLMSIGITPVTAITLPFISYGWPQIFINLVLTGIIMNISKNSTISEENATSS